MLYTIAVVLLVLWLLGMVSGVAVGGFLHILLVLALVAIIVRVIQGRRVVLEQGVREPGAREPKCSLAPLSLAPRSLAP